MCGGRPTADTESLCGSLSRYTFKSTPSGQPLGLYSELAGTYSLLLPQSHTYQESLEKPHVAVISEAPSLVEKAGQWGLC